MKLEDYIKNPPRAVMVISVSLRPKRRKLQVEARLAVSYRVHFFCSPMKVDELE